MLITLKLIMQSNQGGKMLVSAETIFFAPSPPCPRQGVQCPQFLQQSPGSPHSLASYSGKLFGTSFCQWSAQEGIPALLPRAIRKAWKAPPGFKRHWRSNSLWMEWLPSAATLPRHLSREAVAIFVLSTFKASIHFTFEVGLELGR